ncbi:MAG: hypothetical protein ACK4MV_14220 [Beijerinckiaceae bacterium]
MTLSTHAHDHAHPHAHGRQAADGHQHGLDQAHSDGSAQRHDHAHAQRRADPGVSLLRMSALQRVVIALGFVAAIWLGVFWAWS